MPVPRAGSSLAIERAPKGPLLLRPRLADLAAEGLERAAQADATLPDPRSRAQGEGLRASTGTLFLYILSYCIS